MATLDYLSVARFSGAEAGLFLQSQLSADIAALAPGDAGFACYCTPKGQVIGLLLVCRRQDDFLVAACAALLPQILARLKMFVFRTRVEFAFQPDLAVHGVVAGSAAPEAEVFEPAGPGLRYLFAPRSDLAAAGGEAFRAGEIQRRVVWLGTATTEKFIPQMLGFEQLGAVSFSKGCYPGQEIVARAKYLGKVKRKPLVFRTEEPLPAGPAERLELLRGDDWSPGMIADAAEFDGGTILFVVAAAEPGGEVSAVKYADAVYRCATM